TRCTRSESRWPAATCSTHTRTNPCCRSLAVPPAPTRCPIVRGAASAPVDRLAQRPHIRLEGSRPLLGDLDRARADDDAVRELGRGARVLRGGDPEARIERDGDEPACALDERRERGGELRSGAGRAGDRDEV